MIIDNDEMIALNETSKVECTYALEMSLNAPNNNIKSIESIESIESIIKIFLLLNDIEKRQISYLIEMLNSDNEIDKLTVIASLGLENYVKVINKQYD